MLACTQSLYLGLTKSALWFSSKKLGGQVKPEPSADDAPETHKYAPAANAPEPAVVRVESFKTATDESFETVSEGEKTKISESAA